MMPGMGSLRVLYVSDKADIAGGGEVSLLHLIGGLEAAGGIEPFLAALVCNVVVSQRLIRRLCSECARPFSPSEAALESWNFTPEEREFATFMEAAGCPRCKQVGYKGRAGIYETLFFNDDIREMIIQRRSALEIDNCALNCGLLTPLKYSASRKVLTGVSTLEEALTKIMD